MRMTVYAGITLVWVVGLNGCAAMSPYGRTWSGVTVVRPSANVSMCTNLGDVNSASWTDAVISSNIEPFGTVKRVAKRAAGLGANTLVLKSGAGIGQGEFASGTAYHCEKPV